VIVYVRNDQRWGLRIFSRDRAGEIESDGRARR
jgi:hypothetical protein